MSVPTRYYLDRNEHLIEHTWLYELIKTLLGFLKAWSHLPIDVSFQNDFKRAFFSFASRIFEKLPWSYFVFKLSEILCKFFDLIVLFRFDLLFGRLNIHEHSARNRIELRGLGQSIPEKKNKNQFFAQFDFRLDFCRVPIMKKIDTLGNLGQWKAL